MAESRKSPSSWGEGGVGVPQRIISTVNAMRSQPAIVLHKSNKNGETEDEKHILALSEKVFVQEN